MLHCFHCEYDWQPKHRGDHVIVRQKQCPRCKYLRWDDPKAPKRGERAARATANRLAGSTRASRANVLHSLDVSLDASRLVPKMGYEGPRQVAVEPGEGW